MLVLGYRLSTRVLVTSKYLVFFGGFAALLLFWMMRGLAPQLYLFFTALPDGVRKPDPFVDLLSILQAGKCWREGIDVYRPSPCLFGGTFNYSPFLLRAAYLPIGPQDTGIGGILLALSFFAALTLLPRPASPRENIFRLAAMFSLTSFYALEQGNFDVAIFVITIISIRMIIRAKANPRAAYAVMAVLAAVKFYPAALGIFILREPFRKFALIVTLGVLAGLIFVALYAPGIAAALTTIPNSPPFRATFGRIDLFRGFNLLHLLTVHRANHLLGRAVFSSGQTLAACISLLASMAALAASFFRRRRYSLPLKQLKPDIRLFLVAGAAVIVFCFYAAQNVEYRAIFLLLTLPGLWRIGGKRLLLGGILVLLWESGFRALLHSPALLALHDTTQLAFWLLREGLWWWLVIELGAVVLAFVTEEFTRLLKEFQTLSREKIDLSAKKP